MSQPGDKLLVRLSEPHTELIDWLSPGRLAAGKLALIDGDSSQGKSLLTLDCAARLTTGRPPHDRPRGPVTPPAPPRKRDRWLRYDNEELWTRIW
jgi:hypothetical protein